MRPFVVYDVVNPERVFDVVVTLVLVFTETREDVDFVQLMIDGGTLSKTSSWDLCWVTTSCPVSHSRHFTRVNIVGEKIVEILFACNKNETCFKIKNFIDKEVL